MTGYNHLKIVSHKNGIKLRMYEAYIQATYCYLMMGVPSRIVNELVIELNIKRAKKIWQDCNIENISTFDELNIDTELPPFFCASLWRAWEQDEKKEMQGTQLVICWFQWEENQIISDEIIEKIKSCNWFNISTPFDW